MFKYLSPFLCLALFACSTVGTNVRKKNCDPKNTIELSDKPNSITNRFGQLVMWEKGKFPLQIIVDPNMRPERKAVVYNAMTEWNIRTGLTVFAYSEGQQTTEEGTIWITEKKLKKTECGNQIFGLAYRYIDTDIAGTQTKIVRAKIELHIEVPIDRVLGTATHELGHSLGLGHDDEIISIMYPYNTLERKLITQEDVEYVRKMII